MSEEERTPAEAREAAAIRRRWITLGEVLAVVAVLISGLTLWNSYKERSSAEAERAAEKLEKTARSQILLLKAGASGNGKSLALAALDPDQAIQSQTILFPGALGTSPVDTVIEPRIEAGWIEGPAKKARKALGKSQAGAGDRRLPVAITTRFASGGKTYSSTALYDVGYRLDSGLLGGTDVKLRGLSRIEEVRPSKAQARLDAIWQSRQPEAEVTK